MKIAVLGIGAWGTTLAHLLAEKGHEVTAWGRDEEKVSHLQQRRFHPRLLGIPLSNAIRYTANFTEAIFDADVIVEAVTSGGIRDVLFRIKKERKKICPIVFTSKGIEQNTGLLFPEIALEIFSPKEKENICSLSGPSIAEEVIKKMPASVVFSSYSEQTAKKLSDLFQTPTFRVYPNADILGVCFAGAMKNIIAIGCGISDGLFFGDSSKAALMTRGLHEMTKLSEIKKAKKETLFGLAGMGDLCVTCLSTLSRNYSFGRLLAEGYSSQDAREKIGMMVEGAYSVVSAYELAGKYHISVPITQAVFAIIYNNMPAKNAVELLLQRSIKQEHL